MKRIGFPGLGLEFNIDPTAITIFGLDIQWYGAASAKDYTVEVSVAAPSFMYYLNLKPLDRNLEWDMKTNLCPNPGFLGQKQP